MGVLFQPGDWAAIHLSVAVSFVSTGICVIAGLPAALWLARTRSRLRPIVEVLVTLPLVLPPVVTGIGLLFFLPWLTAGLLFTWWAAAAASAVMAAPLFIRTARTAIEALDPRLAAAAKTLGAGPWRVLTTITIPLAWRGLVAATTLAWARSLGEFGATMVVAGNIPHRTRTIPLAIWTTLQSRELSAVLPLVVASVVLSLVAVVVGEILVRRGRRTSNA